MRTARGDGGGGVDGMDVKTHEGEEKRNLRTAVSSV